MHLEISPHLLMSGVENHILQYVQRFLTTQGCSREEIKCYKYHRRFIFQQDTKEGSCEAITELKKAWMAEFTKYFDDHILSNLSKFCKWAIQNLTNFDPYSSITQNQSESMNKPLKSLKKMERRPM